MIDVIVVNTENMKENIYLSPNNYKVKIGDKVIFEIDGVLNIGRVIKGVHSVSKKELDMPLSKVNRIALEDDIKTVEDNKKKASAALKEAKKFVKELKLSMTLVEAFYSFDKSQLFFCFLSEERVDFRELAKKLAQKYKTRIELRQIGVRDKAKKIGGLGPCGLFLCCNSFLSDFNSVSINMAKNQFLALNPTKINGVCGRLLCCLGYENDTYTELKKTMPKMGAIIETEYGIGKVVSIDVFQRKYGVDLKEKGIVELYEDKKNGKA